MTDLRTSGLRSILINGLLPGVLADNDLDPRSIPENWNVDTLHESDRYYITEGRNSGDKSDRAGSLLIRPSCGKIRKQFLNPVNTIEISEQTSDSITALERDMYNGFLDSCYERYKLSWMAGHDLSIKRLLQELLDFANENCPGTHPVTAFDRWETDQGFGSMIWACRDEFETHEFQDPGFMETILFSERERDYYKKITGQDLEGK